MAEGSSTPPVARFTKRNPDLTGKVFGRLTVAGVAGRGSRHRILWRCVCECGEQAVTLTSSLNSGHTRSCGCLSRESARENIKRAIEVPDRGVLHGQTGSPEYMSWSHMIQRCTNSGNDRYHDYGGRGVTVCDRWRESFIAFLEDMGPRPSPSHSIERVDNSKGYDPGNCRWATKKEQQRNTRRNRVIEYGGRSMCVVEWAEVLGTDSSVIHARLRRGWPTGQALGMEPRVKHRGGCG